MRLRLCKLLSRLVCLSSRLGPRSLHPSSLSFGCRQLFLKGGLLCPAGSTQGRILGSQLILLRLRGLQRAAGAVGLAAHDAQGGLQRFHLRTGRKREA